MSATETSTNPQSPVDRLLETARSGQETLNRITRGYETWMMGMMHLAMRQIELGQGILEGSMEDLSLLTAARTPDAFVQAELEVLRRGSGRTLGLAQKISSELNRTWSTITANDAPAAAAD